MQRIRSTSSHRDDHAKSEQQRVKESILSVFRAAANLRAPGKYSHSPIEKSSTHYKKCRKIHAGPESRMSDSDTPQQSIFKTKKKRRRPERKKSRTFSTSKVKDTSTGAKKIDGQQNWKSTNNIVMRDMEIHPFRQAEQRHCAVSNSRITTKLGLFKKGKKSATIDRAVIVIPDSVKEKTDEDLRNILNISGSPNHRPLSSAFSSDQHDHVPTVRSDSGRKSYLSTPKSVQTAAHRSVYSISSSNCSPLPVVPLIEDFPESPPMESIAKSLLSDIKPARWFPGSSYLHGLNEELRKQIKQNCTVNQNRTPMKTITPRSAVRSDTVKRSLLQSLLSDKHTAGHSSAPVERVKQAYVGEMDRPCEAVGFHPQPMETETTHIADINTYYDARSLLSHNDSVIASRSKNINFSDDCVQSGTIPGGYPLPLTQPQTRVTSDMLMSICQDINTNSSQTYDYHHFSLLPTHHPVLGPCHSTVSQSKPEGPAWGTTASKQAVITKMREHPEYMPHFHGDYYKDHLDSSTRSSRKLYQSKDSALDILDMVDKYQTKAQPSQMRHDSPDSSPFQIPTAQILPLKPSLASPSPPNKLYPRRLY